MRCPSLLWVAAIIAISGSFPRAITAAEILMRQGRAGAPPCDGRLLLEPDCEGSTCANAVEIPALAGTGSVILPEGQRWRVRLQSTNCWSAPRVLEDAPATAEVVVWPLRHIRVAIAVPSDAAPPEGLRARITVAAAAIEAVVECERTGGDSWRCPAPEIALDVRFEANNFAPVYVWDVAADDRSTNRLLLDRGASIAGWVESANGPVAGAKVELKTSERSVVTNKRGFFQIVGVQPGVGQSLTVRMSGLSSRTVSDIVVDEGREHVLGDPVHLEELASLQISIMPPTDPHGQPWTIRLSRAMDSSSNLVRMASEPATLAGFWSKDNLESGEYSIAITDGRGSVFERRTVSVKPGIPLMAFQIARVAVRGTVRTGDDPLEARLTFVGSGTRVRMQSDQEGVFRGTLPQAGRWEVEITPRSAFSVVRREVDVTGRGDGSEAVVDIELAAGRIEGSVVDEEGNPARAMVRVRRDRTVAYAETDPSGEFAAVGLEPGSVFVEAITPDGASAIVPHEISTEKDPEPLRIVLESQKQVEVRLVTPAGTPVPGAIVRQIIPPWQRRIESESGPDGRFTVSLTKSTPLVDLVVFAAGFPVKITSVSSSMKSPVTIPLGRSSGKLNVKVLRAPPWPVLRTAAGGYVSLSALMVKMDPFGLPRGMVPGGYEGELEPGTYTVCEQASPTSRCDVVTLQPGGQATVDAGRWSEPSREQPPDAGSTE